MDGAIVVLVLWPWSTLTGILVAAVASVGVRKLSRPGWRNPDHFT